MTLNQKLILVKLIHTIIWLFFNLVPAYLFYAAITDTVDYKFRLGIGVIGLECLILLLLNGTCPLTFWARKYSNSTKDNFDIYLPNWVARHNKLIYSTLFGVLVVIYLMNVVF